MHKGASAKQRKIIRHLIGNLATCDSEFALLFSCLLEFLPQLSEFLSLQQERNRTEQNRKEQNYILPRYSYIQCTILGIITTIDMNSLVFPVPSGGKKTYSQRQQIERL